MVDIQITGVHCHLSEKSKSYIADKLGSLTKYSSRLHSLHVWVREGEKRGYRVDVDMHLPSGKDVVAHDQEDTLFAAVDAVTDKCATQLRKIHERMSEPQRLRA
jgi:ribosomal subunit interface protein